MPEITSVEAVQAKLRQFDEQMEGAISAARTLSRIRSDAEKVLADAENARSQSNEALQKAEAIQALLEQLGGEWNNLKKAFDKSRADSQEIRDLLLSEFDSTLKSLDGKITGAEERLQASHEATLAQHEDSLKRLEGSTRENAETATNARVITTNLMQDAHNLVQTTREELKNNIHAVLGQVQDMLNSQFLSSQKVLEDRVEATLGMLNSDFQVVRSAMLGQAASQEQLLRDEIKAFKEEMRQGLKEHQQVIDRELTDFLNKQNALVQNLNQQIDGFHRVTQALSSDLAQTKADLAAIEITLKAQKNEYDHQATSLSARVAEVSTQLEATISTLKRRSLFTGLK